MIRAGFGSSVLPVDVGEPLGGFVRRRSGCSGQRDELRIDAVSFATTDGRGLLLVVDLVAVTDDLVRLVQEAVAREAGIPGPRCLVAATHTHAAPDLDLTPVVGTTPPHLRTRVTDAALNAAQVAVRSEGPVVVTRHRGTIEGLGGDREPGGGPRPIPADLLAVRDGPSNSILGVVGTLACHPTVLGAGDNRASADLHGEVRDRLGEQLDDEHLPVVLANGAAGDLSTRPVRRGQGDDELSRLGELAAVRLAEMLSTAGSEVYEGPISDASLTIEQPFGDSDSARRSSETLAGRQEEALSEAAAAVRGRAALTGSGKIDLHVLRIGGLVIVGVPGELYQALGTQLESGTGSPMVLGYCNGYVGYLPTRQAYSAGHYAAAITPWHVGTAEAVVEEGQRLCASAAS